MRRSMLVLVSCVLPESQAESPCEQRLDCKVPKLFLASHTDMAGLTWDMSFLMAFLES